MHVVICGAGAIGATTAFFLSERGVDVTLVERTGVACAASGKSGGFLALDWCDGSALGALARASFALHAELPERVGAEWGYRTMDTHGVVARDEGEVSRYRRETPPAWLDGGDAAVHSRLGDARTTAQVHPARYTESMADAARARGASLRAGTVEGLTFSPDGSVVDGAVVDGARIAADAVIVAMGPWSVLACQWLSIPPVYGLKGHSIVLRPRVPIPADALFVEYQTSEGDVHSPEVFPRPDGTVYVCGISDETPLPLDPAGVAPAEGACERLLAMTLRIAPVLGDAELVASGACYRPVAQDAMPLMGPVAGPSGAYLATGHNCWGILNAPASGAAMAELVAEGASTTVDLAPFAPGRLAPLDLGGRALVG